MAKAKGDKNSNYKKKGKPGETAIDVEIFPMEPPDCLGRPPAGKGGVEGGSSGPRPVDPAPKSKPDPTGTL